MLRWRLRSRRGLCLCDCDNCRRERLDGGVDDIIRLDDDLRGLVLHSRWWYSLWTSRLSSLWRRRVLVRSESGYGRRDKSSR